MDAVFFIFGFGYTAEFLAPILCNLGFSVVGTTRNATKLSQQPSRAYRLIAFSDPNINTYLQQATHILLSVPPIEGVGDPVFAQFHTLLQACAPQIQWAGYLSSTGVYGDHQGQWVDESSACIAHEKQGRVRLEAEKAWILFAEACQLPLHTFRLAGIYGPRRNVLEQILSGKSYSIYKEGQFFSRIYVEDIVSVIMASIRAPNPLSIYNVADDEPAPSHVFDAYAAALLHRPQLPLLPFEQAHLSVMAQAFYANNRRVSNAKIKKELGMMLRYPSFREGLGKIMAELNG